MEFEKSRIEKLKRTLYSRNDEIVPKEKRTPVQSKDLDVPMSWGARPTFDLPTDPMKKKQNSFFNKFLLLSLAFFLLALGVASFMFFGGMNMISSDNVDIKVIAPSSVSSGESFDVNISIENGNRAEFEESYLLIEYPEGSRGVDQNGKVLSRDSIKIGTLKPGESKTHYFQMALFGEKDAVKTLEFKLEYKVKGSNAVFSKEKTYDVIIGSSPLLLNVDYPKEVNSGQQVVISLDITSNATVIMKNTLIKVEYPYGFTYIDSSAKPLRDNSVWNIGDLKNGDKKTLEIRGTIVGQNMEDRSFRISAGTQNLDMTKDFDTDLAVEQITMGIRKSFFDLAVTASAGESIAVGQNSSVNIKWQNTLPDRMVNNTIRAVLSGNVFDRSAVTTNGSGFYRSSDSSIAWDKNTTPDLLEIRPSDTGDVSFSFKPISNPNQLRSIKNPSVKVNVIMTGTRAGGDGEVITSAGELIVKLESIASISARSYRQVGPFSNSGSVPPKADKESTYTITWTVTNTTNDLVGGTAKATLPQGVAWKGEVSPTAERLSYNPDTREISWNVGNISSGTGFSNSPKEVSFKVGLTPSVTQVGQFLPLTSTVNFSAKDSYTETTLSAASPAVDTAFSDPGFVRGQEIVVR